MAKTKAAAARRKLEKPRALGPGLHPGVIELRAGTTYHVRMMDEARLDASLGDGVDPALAEECLRTGRLVILCDTPRGPRIMGALQTSRSVALEPDGTVSIEGKAIRLRAETVVRVEAGHVALDLDKSGVMRAEGDRMVIDMGSNVRVLSALVELP